MFDDRVYKRGALMLHAIRLTLGDDAFFAILKAWASEHAYSTVSTAMFIDFVTSRSETPLASLLDEWLNHAELPVLPDGD